MLTDAVATGPQHPQRTCRATMAHWCNLVWIFSTRDSASARSGHGALVFTGDLLAFQQPHR